MTDQSLEPAVVHQFKNHLSVVISLCELLLAELPEGGVREDIRQIHRATQAALTLVPTVAVLQSESSVR